MNPIQKHIDEREKIFEEQCHCVPSDTLLISSPPQHKCINCGFLWRNTEATPYCLIRTKSHLLSSENDLMKAIVDFIGEMKPILWSDDPNRYLENVAKYNILSDLQSKLKEYIK